MAAQRRVPQLPSSSTNQSVVVWSGVLPARNASKSAFSCKVFLGGVPWDITEKDLMAAFRQFGELRVEWPGIHDKSLKSNRMPKGHLYLIFEEEWSVKCLLGACTYDFHHGQHNWFYKVASKRMLVKSVQVIPWQLADAVYTQPGYDPKHVANMGAGKIFVANLHGMITAEGLAKITNEMFGGVIAATLDTDKTKYPIGSGRVTFGNHESHMMAIRAGMIDIRTAKFSRQIKIDPYLEDSKCSLCNCDLGEFFCRNLMCFRYFCDRCWTWQHGSGEFRDHQWMRRPPRATTSYSSAAEFCPSSGISSGADDLDSLLSSMSL
ncbi:Cytoplasmic polyadenylation element-binding protein 1-B [Hypsibius exemplaris]|uniref:Cytoplasmic polyadenylation element-binding protein 1-B n=1 Tax=Hypsibius exemplaris TaxID=2072580 RepID=A0A1W0X0Q0_HYPEX|nr:Cytoplasmic polyadenylation element-binding protein 1-B [Hypsibius exemplaris]